MRYRLTVCLVLALALAGTASAQVNGSIQGRVIYEEQPMPGVTVTVTSPALQGQKIAVTNVQGDYKIPFLPAGDYRVQFSLANFATLEYDVRISTNQPRTLDAVIYPEAVQQEIVVTGQFETVSTGVQGSSTVTLETLEKLPVQRTILDATRLSAGTSDTGPRGPGYISISGGQSYENLYTLNGVVLNDPIRANPVAYYIEDAVQEATVITSGVSAEYGRFSGGVVNTITKSGGNEFSGSLRVNFENDAWVSETPYTAERVDEINNIYELTLGGFILRDRLWFFGAGRNFEESSSGNITTPGQPDASIPYPETDQETRLEGKLTLSVNPSHRVMLSYSDVDRETTNDSFYTPADENALTNRSDPQTAVVLNYNGVFTDNFFGEVQYSSREAAIVGSGGSNTHLGGSPIRAFGDGDMGFNDHWFDGAGAPKERNNENFFAKGSLFFSSAGSHDLVFGFDRFDEIQKEDNAQSASGWALITLSPQNYDTPGNPLLNIYTYGSLITWGEVLENSQGSNMITNSLFVNDTWRISNKLTLNLGLRYDRNDGTDQGGGKVAEDSRVSPRLGLTWDIKGDGEWILHANYGRYVMPINTGIGNEASGAGGPTWALYYYGGANIIAGTPEYPTNEDALNAMFDWFFNVYGGPSNTDLIAQRPIIPGLTPVVGEGGLKSPYGDEYALGVSKRLGNRGALRLDWVHRDYGSFYAETIVPNRTVTHEILGEVDLGELINHDARLERTYDALMVRADYRVNNRLSFGGNYTWSSVEGNHNGETSGSGAVSASILQYEEYKEDRWNNPKGPLITDQEHKFQVYGLWDIVSSSHQNLNLSVLFGFWSGTPYSASGSVSSIPYVGDPADLGYAGSPGNVTYFYGPRGEFTTDDITSTDIALNYSFFINAFGGQVELFLQPEVVNVFNRQGAIGHNSTILDATNSGDFVTFNPFTESPVQGVHWDYGSNFGTPTREASYQTPRTFRFSVGARF